jgi:hypothetical protein
MTIQHASDAGQHEGELALFAATDKGVDPSEYSVDVLRPDPDAEYDISIPE